MGGGERRDEEKEDGTGEVEGGTEEVEAKRDRGSEERKGKGKGGAVSKEKGVIICYRWKNGRTWEGGEMEGPREERKERGRQRERDGRNHIYLSTNKSICNFLPLSLFFLLSFIFLATIKAVYSISSYILPQSVLQPSESFSSIFYIIFFSSFSPFSLTFLFCYRIFPFFRN